MASLYTKDQLPTSSEEAIRKFNEKYLALLSAPEPSDWYSRFVQTVDSPRTTFPMSVLKIAFNETREESGRFKGMSDKTFDVNVSEFDAGFEAKLFDLLTGVFAWKRWQEHPAQLQRAERRHHASKLAALLEGNGACAYDGVAMFATTHLCDPTDPASTQWGNLQAGAAAPTLANIQTEMVAMSTAVLGPDGKKLLVEPDEIWLPTEKYLSVASNLQQAFLANGESNYMAGKIKPVHVPELTDVNDWYLVDSKLIAEGYDPMIQAKFTELDGKLGLRFFDENSDHFKKTGKIAVSQHIWTGSGLLFPHAIRKVVGA